MRSALGALSIGCLLAVQACSTQQDLQPTVHATVAGKLGLNEVEVHGVQARIEPWWEAFGDAQLNQLVSGALSENPSMQVAQSRWQRVQALETYARGNDGPQVQATGEVDRQHFTEHGLYPPPIAGSSRTVGTLQLEGSWEPDFFGMRRSELESAIGQVHAAEADARLAALSLSYQVARAYAQLARLQALREVHARTLAQRDEMLALIRQRVKAGLDTQVELKQGEGALPDVRMQIEAVDEQITLMRHALAALSGQAPSATDQLIVAGSLQPLPAPQQVPVDLLARRPDVMAALWRVKAAGHQVEAARDTFYPNVDLRTYAGYNAIGLEQLLKPASLQWGLLPAIHLPLFDGDRRRANLQGKVADQDAAQAAYNQTVMQAVQETADQISSAQSILRQQAHQDEAQRSAEEAYRLAKERYQAGLGTYLVVLNAESTVLAQRRTAVDLRARAVEAQLSLIRALGGSLQDAAAPATQASTQDQNSNVSR
jgi:NodT family efflux transporter outer membrane factor (OMF) lipoprotein